MQTCVVLRHDDPIGVLRPELGFAPSSERCRVVELKGLECRPCSDHGPNACPLGHFQCMKGVNVEMVYSACLEMLEAGRAPAGEVTE